MRHMKNNDYERGLEEFKKSYAIVASPNSQLMIVRALALLNRKAEAYRVAEEVIASARAEAVHSAKYEQTAEAATVERDDLKSKLGFGVVTVSLKWPNMKLVIDGEEVPQSQWGKPIALDDGTHRVLLMSDWGTESRELRIKAGETTTIEIAPEKPKEKPVEKKAAKEDDSIGDVLAPRNTLEYGAYASMGVGVVGLIGFGVFGGLSEAKFSDLEEQCGSASVCPAELEGDAEDGATFQNVANGMAVVAAVGVLAGGALFAASRTSPEADDVAVQVVPLPGGISLQGSF